VKKTERLKILLEKGYFPEELPPPFNTILLAKYRASIIKNFPADTNQYPKTNNEIYSYPRIKHMRRNLAIPNPISQLHLSKLIADNWVEICKHLKTSKYSIDTLEIKSDGPRAISKPDFGLIALRTNEISANFDHGLVSDISRFYGTLYTHAVPWALHTKVWCKRNLNTVPYKSSLGACIDKAVRKGQDNQTIGIPVGPDTSRIVAEIVGVAIDHHVQNILHLDRSRAFRHVDDWYIGFDNAGNAEDAIANIAAACRTFELELNGEKTRTFNASSFVDSVWPTELREYKFQKKQKGQEKSLEHFFIKAFHYAKEYPTQNVLNYAVKRTQGLVIFEENWRGYETFLLKIARSNMTSIPSVVKILVSYNNDGYEIDKNRVVKLIEDLIRINGPVAHHAEVAWALFLAKALKLSLSEAAANVVSELESSVCALLALDLQQNGLFDVPLNTYLWQQSMNTNGLVSNMWLLAYEAEFKGWLQGTPRNFLSSHRYFGFLKSKKITFYDIKKNVTHIRSKKRWSSSTVSFKNSEAISKYFSWGATSSIVELD
jgi:hypothetical protein